MSTTHITPVIDTAEITKALRLILEPGQVTELRVLEASTSADRRPHIESGYFDDTEKLAEAVGTIGKAKGCYFVPNVVNSKLLSRAANRIRPAGREPTTADHDVISRSWLLIDIDAKRPAGISACDAEHAAAIERAFFLRAALSEDGWPEPIVADSGNGAHLLYRVDLPRDDGGLVKRCLEALAARFNTDQVSVDTAVHNAGRIWKLYGTISAKGDNTPERPHRMAMILEAPGTVAVVDRALLEALATTVNSPAPAVASNGTPHGRLFDIDAWIQQHGLEVDGPEPWQGGRKWVFRVCPFNSDHTNRSAFLIQQASGAIAAGCHHHGCQAKGWHHLRNVVDPGWRERRFDQNRPNDFWLESEIDHDGEPALPNTSAGNGHKPDSNRFTIRRITAAELASTTFDVRFHIPGLLVAEQPQGWFGGKKTLKTNIMLDQAVSVATGKPFLGYFHVEHPARVAVLSGESGMATIQETCNRICNAAGARLQDTGIIFSDTLPVFGSLEHMDALEKFLVDDCIELAYFDPAYLCMLPGGSEGSIFAMGALLRSVSELCQRIGCTPVVLHHMRKSVADPYSPGDLDDASWAGFAEFCRGWTLINRREKYEPGSGLHKLWLSVGGSVGHSGLWGLDIFEGVYTGPGTRVWEVQVLKSEDVRQEVEDADRKTKQAKTDAKLDAIKREIVDAMVKLPSHTGTMSEIRTQAGRNGQAFSLAFAALLTDGTVVQGADVIKGNNRPYEAFTLRNDHD